MRLNTWLVLWSAILLSVTVGACRSTVAPAPPANVFPVISSVVLFPWSIGASDSAIMVCTATDADGDTLVYDWVTDGRVRLKDARGGISVYGSRQNTQTFYCDTVRAPIDTSYIRCYVRDRRGGQDGRLVLLILRS